MKTTTLPETAMRRWTRAEYDRLIGLGMFEGERLELLDGWLVLREPHKASLYARASLPEYWIVDVVHETVEAHREPEASEASRHGWHYRRVETLRPPASVAPLLAPERSIAVADLLP